MTKYKILYKENNISGGTHSIDRLYNKLKIKTDLEKITSKKIDPSKKLNLNFLTLLDKLKKLNILLKKKSLIKSLYLYFEL